MRMHPRDGWFFVQGNEETDPDHGTAWEYSRYFRKWSYLLINQRLYSTRRTGGSSSKRYGLYRIGGSTGHAHQVNAVPVALAVGKVVT
jgi:hypothetical protein